MQGTRPKMTSENTDPNSVSNSGLPEFFDSRCWGGITPIKYQGVCGSCYAFAATGAMEAAAWRTMGNAYNFTKNPDPFSVQTVAWLNDYDTSNVMDTTASGKFGGCYGGNINNTLAKWNGDKFGSSDQY